MRSKKEQGFRMSEDTEKKPISDYGIGEDKDGAIQRLEVRPYAPQKDPRPDEQPTERTSIHDPDTDPSLPTVPLPASPNPPESEIDTRPSKVTEATLGTPPPEASPPPQLPPGKVLLNRPVEPRDA